MTQPSLSQWQQNFKRWVRAEQLSDEDLSLLSIEARGEGAIELKSGRSSRRRVEVYRQSYRARLIESLLEDFSRIAARMGEEQFRLLAERYLFEQPSRFESVSDFSFPFLDYLAGVLPPDLADLARFELEVIRVERLTVDRRLEPALAESSELPFRVRSSVRIRSYGFRVCDDLEDESFLTPGPVTLALYATDSVEWLELESDSISVLEDLLNDLPRIGLDALIERWTTRLVDPADLQRWISDWVNYGILLPSPTSG